MESDQRDRVQLSTGISVPYVTQGDADGLPVLLVHGWAESAGVFDRMLPHLPPGLRVLAYDLRGHGGADKPPVGYDLADASADLCAFLDAVGIESAVLLGSSSGGYLAQELAVRSPRRARALILVGAPRSLHGRPGFADDVDALTDPVDPDWVRQTLTWFPRSSPVPAWYLEDRVSYGVRMPAHAWRASLAGLTAAEPPTARGTIRCATLIIRGADDELISHADHRSLADSIPDSRLLVYPATGHLVVWERPAKVASDVVSFLTRAGAI